jgi:hypothetical protein
MEIIKPQLTEQEIIELGMDLMVQCIKFTVEDKLENPYITLGLNVLGVIYSVNVPKHEADDAHNIKCAWEALIKDFGVMHMMGQSKRIQDGHRELNEEELKVWMKNAIK